MSKSSEDASIAPTSALTGVFAQDCVEMIAAGSQKSTVLRRLVQVLADAGRLPQGEVDSVAESLLERERHGTTGMGRGVAIPHAKTDAVRQCVGAIGVAAEGIDFDSLDGQPTRLVLLVLSPPRRQEEHGAILTALARLFCDRTIEHRVQRLQTAEELLELLEL